MCVIERSLLICEAIWAGIGVSEFADKCTICKIKYRIPVGCGILDSLMATMVLVVNRLL